MASFQLPTHGTDVDKKKFFLIQRVLYSLSWCIFYPVQFSPERALVPFFSKPLLQFLQTLCSLKILL